MPSKIRCMKYFSAKVIKKSDTNAIVIKKVVSLQKL